MKYVFFDIGNVLVDFKFSDFFSIHVGCPKWPDVLSSPRDIEMRDAVESGRITDREWVDYLNHAHDLNWTEMDLIQAWVKMFSLNQVGLDLFRKATASNAVVCTLSNLAEHHTHAIQNTWGNLFEGVDHMFLSYQVGERKPHPYIYRNALNVLGAQASDCHFFDDRIENIEAAAAEGFNAYWFIPENYDTILSVVETD